MTDPTPAEALNLFAAWLDAEADRENDGGYAAEERASALLDRIFKELNPGLLRAQAAQVEAAEATLAPAADEGSGIPPEIVEVVNLVGPAQWSRTPAYTPKEHGEGVTRSVQLTAEHFNQGDEPQHMQMLVREDTDIVIGYIGTSPNSPLIARAMAGAWNHLHQRCAAQAGEAAG